MKKAKKMLAVWLSAALLLTLAPLSALAAQQGSAKEQSWDVSRSKTATNLDQAYRSQVTLSLPSHEEKLVTDVVFVLDESSCSEPVKAEGGADASSPVRPSRGNRGRHQRWAPCSFAARSLLCR